MSTYGYNDTSHNEDVMNTKLCGKSHMHFSCASGRIVAIDSAMALLYIGSFAPIVKMA